MYSQIQKFNCLEITSRSQLYFISRPRKAAKPQPAAVINEWPPSLVLTNQWRSHPERIQLQKSMNILLRPSSESSPKLPTFKNPQNKGSSECPPCQEYTCAFSFPFPPFFPQRHAPPNSRGLHETCKQGSNGSGSSCQADSLHLSPRPPFLLLSNSQRSPT